MPRKPTNTLIITNIDDSLLSNPQPIISILGDQPYMIELIVLMKFKRILLYCQTSKIATKTKTFLLNQWETTIGGNTISISYSLKDNSRILNSDDDEEEEESHGVGGRFLDIPKDLEIKRFLISPPASPHSEWDDWDKVEEGPNETNIHDYLWEKLKTHENEEKERSINDDDDDECDNIEQMELPKIVLNATDN
ncbi:calcipressin-like protein, putative [Candida dubliniensis CD36]|uniref:Calcipressin-like protein, putative n=1 Tax=Candida dubliniensis (strain CD36 / ATCC MYA-646 / CBS 7987 / NCPF 3949 / NRRL Y-17841) TaxID=573826 RepID=B9WIJ5_CANDC|nr:calcipressin-like protein, putative [Candida dubliniensis CD36]CAX41060.1 calcipressin-like protein, putative [Candida dubliniensis CD36]